MQEIKTWPYKKCYGQKLEFPRENESNKLLRDFEIKTDHPILANRPDQVLIHKKKRNYHQMDFAVSAN